MLEMDDGIGGQYSLIYDGSSQPGITQFLKVGLTNGLKYSFRVYAVNFNGKSVFSDIAVYYSCVTPSGFAASKVVSQTST